MIEHAGQKKQRTHRVPVQIYSCHDLRAARLAAGLTQEQAADLCCITHHAYNAIECGRARSPRRLPQLVETLRRYANPFARPLEPLGGKGDG